MGNIIDYAENMLETFEQKPFNSVDSLVLSQFTYLKFEQLVPTINENTPAVRIKELLKAEMFDSMFKNINDAENNRKLLFAVASSPRFRDIRMKHYVSRLDKVTEKQFAAVTYDLGDKTAYIAFRGTDSTLVGWKEDFNMAFISPVPSQEEGVQYLNAVMNRFIHPRKIFVGGHSKGGNIAVYAAMKCKQTVRNCIIRIFNHDGPGFKDSVFHSDDFMKIKDRIHKTLPESSLVGLLFQSHEAYSVVESSRRGIMQHDPFSWSVSSGDFIYADSVSDGALFMQTTLTQWLDQMTDEKRAQFVDTLFQLFGAIDGASENVFSLDWQKAALSLLAAYKNIDAETKKVLTDTISELVKLSLKNLGRPQKQSQVPVIRRLFAKPANGSTPQ